MDRSLEGAQVQRVTLGAVGVREVAILQVRVPGETLHVVLAAGSGVGVVDDAQRARLRAALAPVPSPAQPRWRARLENARIVTATERAIDLVREGQRARAGDSGGALTLELDVEPAEGPGLTWDILSARGARMVDTLERTGGVERRHALCRAVAKAMAKVERRIEAIEGDLAKMRAAQQAAETARLFVVEAARAPRGATSLQAADWSELDAEGAPRTVEMKLDPAKTAQEQIDATFKRARRTKEGARIAHARMAEASAVRDRLGACRKAIEGAQPDLEAIEKEARGAAPRDFKLVGTQGSGRRARPAAAGPRAPYRAFVGAGGAAIYVGKGAAQNDTLTLHVARPHDLWLHAKDRTGAHVIVPLSKGASCPPDALVDAAHLAAHFSDARGERVVDVQYTPRRHLRKPRGSAPGTMIVDREKVLVLRVDEARLAQLLATEVT